MTPDSLSMTELVRFRQTSNRQLLANCKHQHTIKVSEALSMQPLTRAKDEALSGKYTHSLLFKHIDNSNVSGSYQRGRG